MAHVKADRVQETTTNSGGTGALTLNGAASAMRTFGAVMSTGDTCLALITLGTQWEVSLCTFASGANTLTRSTVYSSSTGSLVNFASGTKTISIVAPAAANVVEDNNGDAAITRNLAIGGDLTISGNIPGATFTSDLNITAGDHFYLGWDAALPAMSFGSAINPAAQFVYSTAALVGIYRFSTVSNGAALVLAKSGTSTIGSHAAVASGNSLGRIEWNGSDGSAFQSAGYLSCQVDGSVSAGIVPGRLVFQTANASGVLSEALRLASDNSVYVPGIGTTASAANAFLNSGSSPANQLLRSTSSLAYKRDVETLPSEIADRVIEKARPITYRSIAPADDPAWSWYGLAAEEVAEIDPRLVSWGYKDADYEERTIEEVDLVEVNGLLGPDGRPAQKPVTVTHTEWVLKDGAVKTPDGVAYDRMSVMLLDVVRRDRARIAALEERLAALEAEQ